MNTHNLVITSARIALVSAALGACVGLFHPDDAVAGGVYSAAWVPVHVVQTFAFGGSAFAAVAFGIARARGRLGTWTTVAGVAGAGLASGAAMVEATAAAPLMRTLPAPVPLMELAGPGSPFPVLAAMVGAAILAYVAGFVLLGASAWREGQRVAGGLLIAGTLLELVPLPGVGHGLTILVRNLGVAGVVLPLVGLAPAARSSAATAA